MKNVIVDIGNYNFKYKSDEQGFFSSKCHSRYQANSSAFERITINEVTTYIGVGELEKEYNKATKNIEAQVIYAVTKATKDTSINLCLLMPINQLDQKDILIKKFENKSFRVTVNDSNKTININKCIVLPEGQASYYSYVNKSPYQLMVDIGSRTINWCAYEESKLVKNGTEKLGVYDLYNRILNEENSKGEDFIVEDIEQQIKRGRIIVNKDVYKTFLIDVINTLKGQVNLKNYDVVFTGGGAIVLNDVIKQIEKVAIHQNPLYSNLLGAEIICNKMISGK